MFLNKYNRKSMVDLYSKISECRSKGIDVVLVTVTEKEGMGPADVGKKMLVTSTGESFGTIGGGSIEHLAREKCKDIISKRLSFTEKYILNDKDVKVDDGEVIVKMACGGKCTLFYEFIGPKQFVYIFGGGHCGKALAKHLVELDFHVTVIDNRRDIIEELEEIPNEKICDDFALYVSKHDLTSKFVVVSTPSHTHDFEVLDKIIELKQKPAYFGMLCSKKKIADYLNLLYSKHGKNIDLSNFYAPIGLVTGGDSPEEVAISITSEILSVYYSKNDVKHMRERSEIKYWEKF